MRYELDSNGYILKVFFGCTSGSCAEYTGTIPESYTSLGEWAENENINAWKIVDGNLVYDANRAAEIERKCEYETNRNTPATQGYVNDKLNQSNEILIDELSNDAEGTQLIELKDSGDYEINSLKIPLSNEMYLKYKGAIEQYVGAGGINLFSFLENKISTQNQITSEYKDNIVELNGTSGYSGQLVAGTGNRKSIGKFKAGTYTLFTTELSGSVSFGIANTDFAYYLYDSIDGKSIAGVNYNGLTLKKTFTLTEEKELYIGGYINQANATFTNYVLGFVIHEGTENKSYEQYIPTPSPECESEVKTITGECELFRCNKNLLNFKKWYENRDILLNSTSSIIDISEITENSITFTAKNDDAFTMTYGMSKTDAKTNKAKYDTWGGFGVKENTSYAVSYECDTDKPRLMLFYYDKNFLFLSFKDFIKNGDVITTPANAKYATFRIGTTQRNGITTTFKNIQVEENTVATDYTQHQSQSFPLSLGSLELCGDDNFQDYIYSKNGKRYLNNRYITMLLNEKTQVTYFIQQGDYTLFQIPAYNVLSKVYCNKLKYDRNWGTSFNYESVYKGGSATKHIQIKISTSRLSEVSASGIKQWLGENNMKVYCELETPTEEEITDTTLLAQLDTITRELKLDKDVVHFYLQSENGVTVDVPMYYEDGLQLKVTNKNLIKNNAVSQTINDVEITVNEDKTMSLNGTATADIELILNGTDTNTDMLFLLKSNIGYYQNGLIDGVSIGLYNYDGTDRTELSNISNGQINLSDDGVVTEVILKIANGTAFSNAKIYPMLTISDDPEQYTEAQENSLIKMDLSSFIFNTDDYIEIKDDNVSLVSGDNTEHLKCLDAPLKTFSPETYLMLNRFNDMSINYFRKKYLAERINKIESDIDGIKMEVSESFKATETVTGHKIVRMENAFAPANVTELRITGEMSLIFPSEDLFPSETLFPLDSYLIVDKSETLSEDAQKIHLPLYYLHYMDENVHDEFIVTADECKFIKRVGKNADGSYYALTEPIEKTYEGVEIPQFEDVFYMYLENFRDADLTYRVIYEIKNYVNDNYASKAVLQLFSNAILAEVAKKIGNDEVIARINMAILGIEDAEIPEDINKSIIEILANKISIKSDNFELTKEGIIKSIAGEIGGWIINKTNLEKAAEQTIIYSRNDTQDLDVLADSEEIGRWDYLCYPSADAYKKFDFDGDGSITDADREVYASLPGGFGKTLNTTGTVKFNSNDIFNTLVFENETMNSKTGIGTLGVTTNLLEANVGFVKKLFCTEGLILPIADRLIKAFPVLSRSNDHVHQFDIESYNNLNALVLYSDNTFYGRYLPVSENHRNIETPASNGTITILTDKGTYLELQTGANTYMINYVTSDEKLKENIEKTEIESALSLIKQINLYSFDWLVNGKHEKIGFIANELYELDAILADKIEQPNGEYLYQYNDKTILALQTKAIQELNAKVEKQQKMIDFLINKLDCKEELENFMKGEN